MKQSKIISEFKKFIARGSVVDLACGVIMGSAFSAITNSIVNDIIMPIAGFLLGGTDFSSFKIVLRKAGENTAEVAIRYGKLLNAVLNFIIIAFVVFWIVKGFNRLRDLQKKADDDAKKKEEQKAPAKAQDIILLEEIRDILKADSKAQ